MPDRPPSSSSVTPLRRPTPIPGPIPNPPPAPHPRSRTKHTHPAFVQFRYTVTAANTDRRHDSEADARRAGEQQSERQHPRIDGGNFGNGKSHRNQADQQRQRGIREDQPERASSQRQEQAFSEHL